MRVSASEYVKSGRYLPVDFRDFHDQKDLFKTIDAAIDWKEAGDARIGWVTAHCYVIDIFLWWMAKRGWTLQRSRASVDFLSYRDDLERRETAEAKAFASILTPLDQVSP